jgi:hypothetical protein
VARAVAESQAQHGTNSPDPTNAWTAAIAGLGLLDQQPDESRAYLWPDNVVAWGCWQRVQTQWRVGMGGATGLDYAGVRAYLDEANLAGAERRDVFDGICACERATLDVWAAQRERDQASNATGPAVPQRV